MRFKFTFLVVLLCSTSFVYSQQLNLPLNGYFLESYDAKLNAVDSRFHTSVKPYLQSELDSIVNPDSLNDFKSYNVGTKRRIGRIWNNFINDHLIKVDTGDFKLSIDPLFDFQAGKENHNQLYVNTRGVFVNGSISKKFSFSSSFYENQALFASYIDAYIAANKVVPGQGEAKPFKSRGYDYSMANGYISYSPSKYFNFQFGHGKNFIGDGYRSLLLSDNAFNYPYFKITTTIWKIKYVNLFAQFQDIRMSNVSVLGKGYPKKFGTFHYLSWNVTKRWDIGLFESIIWQGSDSAHYRGFDLNYLNPVIFFRPVEFSLGSPDNALIGMNSKFKLSSNIYLYGQLIIDDLKISELKKNNPAYHQKYGYQLGVKGNNLFKISGLGFRTEYNYVTPFTYAHRLSMQNYGHYNQPLAHPMGANFKESVSFLTFRKKRMIVQTEFLYGVFGADSARKDFGGNIFAAEYDLATTPLKYNGKVGQGVKTNIIYSGVTLGYIVNPKINMRVEVGYTYRKLHSDLSTQSLHFVTLGLKTSLSNFYYDF